MFYQKSIDMARTFDVSNGEINEVKSGTEEQAVVAYPTARKPEYSINVADAFPVTGNPGSITYKQQTSNEYHPDENEWALLNDLIVNGDLQSVRNWFQSRGLGSSARQLWTINSYWPLQTAARAGNVEVLDALLQYGFDPLEVNFFGDGLVHTAAAAGHTGMVDRLIQLGLFVSIRDSDEVTPLHFAARTAGDNSKMIKYLVGRQADLNVRNRFQETPLHVASGKGSIHNVIALIESGACVNARRSNGVSPLFCAIRRRGNIEEHVKILCDMGAISAPCQGRFCEFYAASTVQSLEVIVSLLKRNFCMSCALTVWNDVPLYHIASTMESDQRRKAIDIIMRSGYCVKNHFRLLQNLMRYPDMIDDKDVLQRQLLRYATTPRSLRQLSCFTIRKVLGPLFLYKLDCLPLPDILKDIVRLKDVLSSFHSCSKQSFLDRETVSISTATYLCLRLP